MGIKDQALIIVENILQQQTEAHCDEIVQKAIDKLLGLIPDGDAKNVVQGIVDLEGANLKAIIKKELLAVEDKIDGQEGV